jgi:hypothetical protein
MDGWMDGSASNAYQAHISACLDAKVKAAKQIKALLKSNLHLITETTVR